MKNCEILPEFLINWLKGIEFMSTTVPSIKEFKPESYIQLTIYSILLILVIIMINFL